MSRLLIVIILVFLSFDLIALRPVPVHSHKFYSEGVLPEPYGTYALRIELDEETDDVTVMEFRRGSEYVQIPESIIEQLKEVELNTIILTHDMHRTNEEPASPFFEGAGDSFHIEFELGEEYRAKKVENKVTYYKWGKDSIIVSINNKNNVTVTRRYLNSTHGHWFE